MSSLLLSLQAVLVVGTLRSPGIRAPVRAPVYSNIFQLPTIGPDTEGVTLGMEEELVRETFQPVFDLVSVEENQEEIVDNSLEEEEGEEEGEELPRVNKALLKSYVEQYSGTGQQFLNSKHLGHTEGPVDKALDVLDQLHSGPNVTVDSSGKTGSHLQLALVSESKSSIIIIYIMSYIIILYIIYYSL